MTAIFVAISKTFVDSGFSTALIRKKDANDVDFSSVFYFNILLGLIIYFLLFFAAPLISKFFEEPQLTYLIRVISLGLIIGSFGTIQTTLLTKHIDFKLQTQLSVVSTLISGSISITMAVAGYGVWSLVFSGLISSFSSTLLLWYFSKWRPRFVFSIIAIKELFSFGSKLLISRLINVGFENIYYLVIGKYFSASDLGYYTRANNFQKPPSQVLTAVIQRVTYPVLSAIQDDTNQLKAAYSKLIKSTMFISFVLTIGMAASAESMVLTLIGEKWLPSVEYLQLLCFGGMLYPLHAINLNMLNVQGRSDLFLKLEIIKKSLIVPVVFIGIQYGIKEMIYGMLINGIIAYFLNSYYSGRKIGYSSFDQLKDIFPSFLLAAFMGTIVFLIGIFVKDILSSLVIFTIQVIAGATIVFTVGEVTKMRDYYYIRQIAISQFRNIKTRYHHG